MALPNKDVEAIDVAVASDLKGVPVGKIICLAKAAWKAYKCETGGGTHCIQTLITDVEACLR